MRLGAAQLYRSFIQEDFQATHLSGDNFHLVLVASEPTESIQTTLENLKRGGLTTRHRP